MSFALTTQAIKDKTKTVTRRTGWLFLKAGDELNAVVKSQGLKKGEKVEHLARLKVTSVRREPIAPISHDEVIKEGFPHLSPHDFVSLFCKANKCSRTAEITRIEFEYV